MSPGLGHRGEHGSSTCDGNKRNSQFMRYFIEERGVNEMLFEGKRSHFGKGTVCGTADLLR